MIEFEDGALQIDASIVADGLAIDPALVAIMHLTNAMGVSRLNP